MIRFNIIGTGFLDFEEGGNLAFTAKNQWFRFAEVSMARSVEFTVPATDRNRAMLNFGEDVNEYGEMLRVNHDCQMVYDGGAMMGTLSVTAYDGNAFKCVFFLKSAPWIERLQDLKLSDCPTSYQKGLTWSGAETPVYADAADPEQECLLIQYENGLMNYIPNWQVVPSVNIKTFLEDILGNLGVPFMTQLDDSYWMISGSMNGGEVDVVTFGATATNSVTISQTQGYFTVENITIEWARSNVFGLYVGGGSTNTQGFKATQDVEITFGASVAKPLFLIKWDSRLGRCEVLGGSYSSGATAGVNPLDGRTVQIKKGDIVFFAKHAFYDIDANGTYMGWKDIAYPMSETCNVSRSKELVLGEVWQLRNNMPDMTVFEFLRSVALATGLELTISPDGIVLGNAAYGNDFVSLGNVISIDTVERVVESWGNDTIVALTDFDSEEYVTERLVTYHDIDNQTRKTKVAHTSKFSEGNLGKSSNNVEVLDVSFDGVNYKFKAKKWTIAQAVSGEPYLQRVALPNPVGYDDIAENSTCVKMKVAASEAEFFALGTSTTLLWRGAAFVWTDANLAGNVMSLTLQRVSKMNEAISPTPPPVLTGIEATFDQLGNTIYDTNSLDDLKQYLRVVANYDDGTSSVVPSTDYVLSGSLVAPSSTITVSFEGETDTFTVLVTHQQVLPYDAEVEYLKSSGTQYIDTNIEPHKNIAVEIKWKNEETQNNKYLFGSGTSNSNGIRAYIGGAAYWRFGGGSRSMNTSDTTERTATMDNTKITINGTDYNYNGTVGTFTSETTIKFFASASGTSGISTRIYYVKIYDNGNLVRDFIPVRVGTTGYMYDKVSGTLFGNDGTGDFVVGADV